MVKQPTMNEFERAIKRIVACNKLISEAEKDIGALRDEIRRAQKMIDGWTMLIKKPHLATPEMQRIATEIADQSPRLVSVMNIGIEY